jgi:hypothetical protein
MNLDLYSLKWSTTNFVDLVQVYRDLDQELCHVRDQYAQSMDPVRKAYYQGATKALLSAEDKLLEKLVNLLEEHGYVSALDDLNDDFEARMRKARPIMELLVQELWQ